MELDSPGFEAMWLREIAKHDFIQVRRGYLTKEASNITDFSSLQSH
jgi:hypothetical protein